MTAIEPRAGPVRRLDWRRAQVREVIVETSRAKSLLLQVDGWQGHLPGQHVDIRPRLRTATRRSAVTRLPRPPRTN